MGLGVAAAAVGAAGAIGGAVISSSVSSKAAATSKAAADQSLAEQQKEFGQTTADNKPFLATGTSALNQLAGLYGLDTADSNGNTVKGSGTGQNIDPNATFYQTPDYKFNLSQGLGAIDAGAAARGQLNSGATLKAEQQYGAGLASGQFNNYATRLQGLAGIGQSAANSQSAAGANYANNYTNTVTAAANTQANLTGAQGQTTANALSNIAGSIGQTLGKNPFGSSYGATPAGTNGASANLGAYGSVSGSTPYIPGSGVL